MVPDNEDVSSLISVADNDFYCIFIEFIAKKTSS